MKKINDSDIKKIFNEYSRYEISLTQGEKQEIPKSTKS